MKRCRSLVIAAGMLMSMVMLAGCAMGRKPVAGGSSVSGDASFESRLNDDRTAPLELLDDTDPCEDAEGTEADPEDELVARPSSEISELWDKLLTCYRGDPGSLVAQYYMDGKQNENPIPVVISAIFVDHTTGELFFRQAMFELAGVKDDLFISSVVSLGLGDIVEQTELSDHCVLREVEIAWVSDDGERYSISSLADELWDFRIVCRGEDAGNYLYGRYMLVSDNLDEALRQTERGIDAGGEIILLGEEEAISDENFSFEKVVEICLIGGARHTEV